MGVADKERAERKAIMARIRQCAFTGDIREASRLTADWVDLGAIIAIFREGPMYCAACDWQGWGWDEASKHSANGGHDKIKPGWFERKPCPVSGPGRFV
jgi:hypothetical protein